MLRDHILEEILALPADERRQLIDIITKSLEEAPNETLKPRILGLGANLDFWISDDFDDPIFPDNWMDDPSDPLNWKHDKKDADQ
jgi:hypothetical protein